MNKKAKLMKPVIVILIFLVVLVVLSMFLLNLEEVLQKFVYKSTCKTAVRANAIAQGTGKAGVLEAFQRFRLLFEGSKVEKETEGIKCPTRDIIIKEGDKEIIKQRLADTMYECFDNFGFGTLKLFEPKPGEEKYCVVCHRIYFEGKARNKFIGTDEFDEFLKDEYIETPSELKDIYSQKKISYRQAFTGYSTDEDVFKGENIKTGDYNIATSIPYATIFTYTKKGYWTKTETGLFGAFFGMAAGLILLPFTAGASASLVLLGSSALAVAGGGIGYEVGYHKLSDMHGGIILMPFDAVESGKLKCTYLPGIQEPE